LVLPSTFVTEILGIIQYDKSVNSGWVPSVIGSWLNGNQTTELYSNFTRNVDCDSYGRMEDYVKHAHAYEPSNTTLSILINFNRNYSIAAITIPIVGIF
jgi:hypothetical protein